MAGTRFRKVPDGGTGTGLRKVAVGVLELGDSHKLGLERAGLSHPRMKTTISGLAWGHGEQG